MFRNAEEGRLVKVGVVCVVLLVLVLAYVYFLGGQSSSEDREASASREHTEALHLFDRRGVLLDPLLTSHTGAVRSREMFRAILVPVREYVNQQDTLSRAPVTLTLDAEVSEYVYEALERIARGYGYHGGAGVIMDVDTGELLALASYGEGDGETFPMRATQAYIPGSVMKLFVALGALTEKSISPETKILSGDPIRLPNPAHPGTFFVYKDWKAHGYVDMPVALGVSSNMYFYTVGGGYGDIEGLGIERLRTYFRMFGFGSKTGIDFVSEEEGFLPSPDEKALKYNGDPWRVGDTYLASIGQHEFGVTPLQLTRAIAVIANGGELVTPTLLMRRVHEVSGVKLPISAEDFAVVREGMAYSVDNGTAAGLSVHSFSVSAKTGTAEVGGEKEYIHSWITGYFPRNEPRYAFTLMLERGPWGEEVGAVAVARDVLEWVHDHRPEYVAKSQE